MREVNKHINKRKKENRSEDSFCPCEFRVTKNEVMMSHEIRKAAFDADKQNSRDNETAAGGDPCDKVLLRPKPWSNSK